MLKKAIVFGSTGGAGRQVIRQLISNDHFSQVTAALRKNTDLSYFEIDEKEKAKNSYKYNQIVMDFENMDTHSEAIALHDAVFYCLGTSQSKAGSKEKFRHIDFDYTISAANILKNKGQCQQFHYVSGGFADINSSFFYSKVKGEVEEALKKIGFPFLCIYRPGILLTSRSESNVQCIVRFLSPILPYKYQGIKTDDVAKFMINTSEKLIGHKSAEQNPINNTYEQDVLVKFSKGKI